MKIIKFKILSIILILVTLTAISCKTTTTEPIIKPDPKPIDENPSGRRDYDWTVDTIYTFNAKLYRLWGSSDTDIWACGTGGSIENFLWHYNGEKWTRKDISANGWIDPCSIYGFSKNDLWMVGFGSKFAKIWQGDGVNWKQALSFNQSDYNFSSFYDIVGESPDNMYAFGSYDSLVNGKDNLHGLIFHYDGKEWKRFNLEKNDCQYVAVVKNQYGKYYVMGDVYNTITGRDTVKIIEFDGTILKDLYSVLYSGTDKCSMALIKGEVLFLLNSKICRYKNDSFQDINTFNELIRGYLIGGRNENDLFFNLPEGMAHYNGTDLQIICKPPQPARITRIEIFGDKIFLLAVDGNNSYMIKGVLKNEIKN